jgi:DNA oxidative demethylase
LLRSTLDTNMVRQLSLGLGEDAPPRPHEEALGPSAVVLRGFALPSERALLEGVAQVLAAAAPRHVFTPGGRRMSVAMSNCGALGWVSDARGYRYTAHDPETGSPWPPMPAAMVAIAQAAAAQGGFPGFAPDACLINRYEPGARMTLHQDKDEQDLSEPIVSVSLGLPITFLWGGNARSDRPARVLLEHGDVVVWGGPSRLVFHGVLPLRDGHHEALGAARINLTFRRAAGRSRA